MALPAGPGLLVVSWRGRPGRNGHGRHGRRVAASLFGGSTLACFLRFGDVRLGSGDLR